MMITWTFYTWMEAIRVTCYGVGVLLSLYLVIEFSNRSEKTLATVMMTMTIMYAAQLATVALRYLGVDASEARVLLTPAVVAHTTAMAALVHMEYKRKRVQAKGSAPSA